MSKKTCKNCIWNYDKDTVAFCDEQRKNGNNPCDRHLIFSDFVDSEDSISVKDIEDIIDQGEE